MGLEVDDLLNEDFDGTRKFADVGIIEGMMDSERGRFYLKRTYHEPLGKILRQAALLRTPHYNTAREAVAIGQLNARGFATQEVVASGERRRWGIPVGSFLLAREVKGVHLASGFRELSGERRVSVLRAYGELLAGLHDAGFFHRLKFNDLIATGIEEETVALVMIDRDVSAPRPKRFFRRRLALRNAASNLRLVMKTFPLSAAEGRAFLGGYKGRSELFRSCSKFEWYGMLKKKYLTLISR